jgi:predicted SAM-dependent methyltransferase
MKAAASRPAGPRQARLRTLAFFSGLLRKGGHKARAHGRSLARRAVAPRKIRRYLRTHPHGGLQLGAGLNLLPGWLNTDGWYESQGEQSHGVVELDATHPFPIRDCSFQYVFSEHLIEHLTEAEAAMMLRECFRVLRPGGRIRIATPDVEAIVSLYDEVESDLAQHYVRWVTQRYPPHTPGGDPRCHVVNRMFSAYGHRFIYDRRTLAAALVAAGFSDIREHAPGSSDDPALQGLEGHGRTLGDEAVNRFETMVLEASRTS